MRLDKYVCDAALLTRTEAARVITCGSVSVNGKVIKDRAFKVNEDSDTVLLSAKTLVYKKYIYIMLNKPDGYVSATEDKKEQTVLELLSPELKKKYLFPVGRLDKNTLGLLLLTNNGQLAHKLLSPRSHAEKVYRFAVKFPLSEEDICRLENGITLDDGYVTQASTVMLDRDSNKNGTIAITEGKFHQIKRMMEAVNNQIIYLERINFGPLKLDKDLERGSWRYLTDEEIGMLESLL